MSRLRRLRALGALSLVVLLTGCGAPAPAPQPSSAATSEPSGEDSSGAAPSDSASAAPGSADVKPGETGIVVSGSGNATVGPIVLDQKFYLVKTTYTAADEASPLTVMYKTSSGDDMPLTSLFGTGNNARVLQKSALPAAGLTLAIEANGSYTIEFLRPASLGAAKAAPQTFSGQGAGITITPVVSTKGTYVMLGIKNMGTITDNAGGLPLATATLYDATTGDECVRNQSFYQGTEGNEDGFNSEAPASYFAIISARDGASWQVKVSEG